MKNITLAVACLSLTASLFSFMPVQGSQNQEHPRQSEGISTSIEGIVLSQGNSLVAIAPPKSPDRIVHSILVIVTAYSSTPDQTDDTPFITASGKHVRDGIVATNLLPMGTKIKIPTLYQDRIFVVEDRMHPRKSQHVDIWFPTYIQAKNFGVKNTHIEILGG